jgi:hypothetical protein
MRSNKTKRSSRCHRRRRGGAAAISSVIDFLSEPPGWFRLLSKIPDATRAAAALIHDVNRAYEFYSYCESINLDTIPNEALKQRFTMMMTKLGKLIMSIKSGAVVPKMVGALHSIVSKNKEAYNREVEALSKIAISTREDVPKPPETILSKLTAVATTTFNTSIITMLGDWYRYEINIDLTNLMAVVTEMVGLSVLNTVKRIPTPLVTPSTVFETPGKLERLPISEAENAAAETAIHLDVIKPGSPTMKSRRRKKSKKTSPNLSYHDPHNPFSVLASS